MKHKRAIRVCVGLVLTVGFTWLVARQVSVTDIQHALQHAYIPWIIAALLSLIVGYVFRIERWHIMLRATKSDVLFKDCAGPFIASFAINNTLPLRAGDAARAFAFRNELQVGPSVVIGTMLAERLLDLAVVLLALGVVPILLNVDLADFGGMGSVIVIAAGLAVLGVLFVPRVFLAPVEWGAAAANHVSPRLGAKIQSEVGKIAATVTLLSHARLMLLLVTLSFIAWGLEGLMFWFAAMALPALAQPMLAWLALPAATLSTLIPSAPGYVGTFGYVTAQATSAGGFNSLAVSTVYAVLVHLLLWLPITACGGVYLLARGRRHTTNAQKEA